MAAKDYAGLIGTEFLERFTVVFDSPGKRILLNAESRLRTRLQCTTQSGLRIQRQDPGFHRFVVRRILLQSPAAASGIESGDIIRIRRAIIRRRS